MNGLYKPGDLRRAPKKARLDVAAYRVAERVVSERDPIAWHLLEPTVQAIARQFLGPRTTAGRMAARLVRATNTEEACKRKRQYNRINTTS